MISEARKTLRINEAFPKLFSRSVPRIKLSDSTLKAIHALLSNHLDVLPLVSEGQDTWSSERAENSPRGISGYSIVSRLVKSSGSNLDNFLTEQCSNSALTLGTVSFESDDLKSLLYMFEVTSFGYSIVSKKSDGNAVEVVSLMDFLPLYTQGMLASKLKVKDVASSPVTTISRESTLIETLSEMSRKKFRRAKIED